VHSFLTVHAHRGIFNVAPLSHSALREHQPRLGQFNPLGPCFATAVMTSMKLSMNKVLSTMRRKPTNGMRALRSSLALLPTSLSSSHWLIAFASLVSTQAPPPPPMVQWTPLTIPLKRSCHDVWYGFPRSPRDPIFSKSLIANYSTIETILRVWRPEQFGTSCLSDAAGEGLRERPTVGPSTCDTGR
jgi:hypothetical protein